MRTRAEQFFSADQALVELDSLSFAFRSLADTLPRGSYERENADNAVRGVKARIDYLHDCFSGLLEPTKAYERYEKLRRLNPHEFQKLYHRNIEDDIAFDALVDELTS